MEQLLRRISFLRVFKQVSTEKARDDTSASCWGGGGGREMVSCLGIGLEL